MVNHLDVLCHESTSTVPFNMELKHLNLSSNEKHTKYFRENSLSFGRERIDIVHSYVNTFLVIIGDEVLDL